MKNKENRESIIIRNLSDYISCITKASEKLIQNGANKNEIALFRGHSDKSYQLIPSICRDKKGPYQISIFDEERNLIEMAKYKLPDVFRNDLSPIELLALLQHHGIPTRLLDVTENALVALYFACCSNTEKDAEVIMFKHNEIDVTNYPIINAIAEGYKFTRGAEYELGWFYKAMMNQPYFAEQKHIHEICNSYGQEKQIISIEECCSKPLFVYAPIRSYRQRIQMGRYILFPNRIEPSSIDPTEKCFETIIDPIPKNHECIISVIDVPKENKESILNDLKLFGISEETLFGDNIDIVCSNIKTTFENKVRGKRYIGNEN